MSLHGRKGPPIRIWKDFVIPSPSDLRDAFTIDLNREAGSDAARALAGDVLSLILPHRAAKRPLGLKGRPNAVAKVGTILAGLLRRNRPVKVSRRPGSWLWTGADGPMGTAAFWGHIDALIAAGLVDTASGTRRGWRAVGEVPAMFRGWSTCLWASEALWHLADQHGVSREGYTAHWPITRAAETRRVVIPHDGLVVVKDRPDLVAAAPLTAEQCSLIDRERAFVAKLNARVAASDIRGCPAPAFSRVFLGHPCLGGRLYAQGGGTYQQMSKAERGRITIDGEPTVELDIRASLLTIFLRLTGTVTLPDGDPYAVGGLPREAVKAWINQSFGSGLPKTKWGDGTPSEVREHKVRTVGEAVRAAYPAFARPMTDILPPELAARATAEKRGIVAGQHLVWRESQVVCGAIGYVLLAHNQSSLPIHDSLIVPRSAERYAREGLFRACKVLVGIEPVIR